MSRPLPCQQSLASVITVSQRDQGSVQSLFSVGESAHQVQVCFLAAACARAGARSRIWREQGRRSARGAVAQSAGLRGPFSRRHVLGRAPDHGSGASRGEGPSEGSVNPLHFATGRPLVVRPHPAGVEGGLGQSTPLRYGRIRPRPAGSSQKSAGRYRRSVPTAGR